MTLPTFAIFVITALADGDYKYTHIKTYKDRYVCEKNLNKFVQFYEPFENNEIAKCLKVG